MKALGTSLSWVDGMVLPGVAGSTFLAVRAALSFGVAPGYVYSSGPTGTLQYTFPSGQNGIYNSGQISQVSDGVSGETTVYAYL